MTSPAGMTAGGAMLMVAVILTAAGIAQFSRFYRRDLDPADGRELPLDGLRGMAALLVVAHHSGMARMQLATGAWGDAGSPVLQAFGPAGVLLFFMLTGYLFWSKARSGGGKLNALSLWRGRVYRIAPLYLFSVACLLGIATVHWGFDWLAPRNWKALGYLLTLGFAYWLDVGKAHLGDYNAGVVWTLWYEWRFYLALPFLAWLAVGRRTLGLAAAAYVAVFIGLWFHVNLQPGLIFILGMLCPVLLDNPTLRLQLRHPAAAASALAAAAILGWLNYAKTPTFAFGAALFPLFLAAAAGNSFFGFLVHPAIRCLGAISYSLYLLHFVVFYLIMNILISAGWADFLNAFYWPVMIAAAALAALLCAGTYRWIEFPFLSIRRKISASSGRRSFTPSNP